MDNKFFSFKRFVTFGLGLGIFMSAASGFAQTATATAGNNSYVIDHNGSSVANGNTITVNANGTAITTQTLNPNGTVATSNTVTVGKNGMATSGTINITGRAPDGQNGLYIGEAGKTNTRIDVTGAIYGPANSTVSGGHNYSIAANGGITAHDLTTRGGIYAGNKGFQVDNNGGNSY